MCMTIRENKFELLSAFLDGEKLSDEQLLELMGDEEVMAKWDEYTFQRAVVRDELPKGVDMKSFSEGLVSRLAQEPQYISIAKKGRKCFRFLGVSRQTGCCRHYSLYLCVRGAVSA